MNAKRLGKKEEAREEEKRASLVEARFACSSLLQSLSKKSSYQDPKYVNGLGEKLKQDLEQVKALLARWKTGQIEGAVADIFSFAHKDSFGFSRSWTKQKASEEVIRVTDQLLYTLRVNRFIAIDTPSHARALGIKEKVVVATVPEPFVNYNDVNILCDFLRYAIGCLHHELE